MGVEFIIAVWKKIRFGDQFPTVLYLNDKKRFCGERINRMLLKKYLLLIVSVIGIAVGILSGCGEKEYWQDEYSRKKWAGAKQALSAVAGIWQKVEETVLCPMGDYPEYGGGEDLVSYFQDRYPDMYRLSAYLWGEDTLWNFEESMFEDIFYEVESPDGIRGFFRENGKVHEIFSENGSAYDESVQGTKQDLGYDYYPFFTWKKEGEGNTSQSNYLTDVHDYMREIGDGKGLRIQAEAVKRELREKISGEQEKDNAYQIKVYDEKGLLQEIQVNVTQEEESPFSFEDFNADGYQDLTVVCYLGTFGCSVKHYIYNPVQRIFVELDPEFECYADYVVDPKRRRLYMYSYGIAITGREAVFQWKGWTDYEMVKQFMHDETQEGIRVKVVRYEEEEENVLCDYLYSHEEYLDRTDIWGTYLEDFIWEKEVTDRSTGRNYTIRYAEVFQEEAERNQGGCYDRRIYVYDEDTYLVRVTHSENPSKSGAIEWEDGAGNRAQAVVIHDADGGKSTFYLSRLIRPDDQYGKK